MSMNSLSVPCQVIKSSKRKTAVIQIKEQGVIVRVPVWVSDDWVNSWLHSRQNVIEHKFFSLQRDLEACAIILNQGGTIPYLGHEITLSWDVAKRLSFDFDGTVLHLTIGERSQKPENVRVKEAVKKWYRQEAEAQISQSVVYWQGVMGLTAKKIKVRDYKGRWGSCNAQGEIAFNWRLVFGEPELIDYVVIHELAHLEHLNHSSAFWSLVEQYCPDWREKRKTLQRRMGWVLW